MSAQEFFTYLNSLDPKIQFTTESPDQQGCLLLLDRLTSLGPDGTVITMVYRKPIHTYQYLHWDRHHSITNKYNVYNTLSHRAQDVCSNQQLLKQENQHIPTALCRCNYPDRVFCRFQAKLEFQLSQKQWHNSTNFHRNKRNHNTFVVEIVPLPLKCGCVGINRSRGSHPMRLVDA